MPKVSDEYLETKQEQILDAAIACFARNGFAETTIEDICQEAGLSHGAIYRYFQSKEDIIEASCLAQYKARRTRYAPTMQQDGAREILRDFLSIYFRRRREPEPDAVMKFQMQLYGEAVRNTRIAEIQRQGLEEMQQSVASIIHEAQKKGEINPDLDDRAVARVVAAFADGFYIQKSVTPEMDTEKCLEAVKAIFFDNFWLSQKKEETNGSQSQQEHVKVE